MCADTNVLTAEMPLISLCKRNITKMVIKISNDYACIIKHLKVKLYILFFFLRFADRASQYSLNN